MDFNVVVLGDHSKNTCTPHIDNDFTGIKISLPVEVKFSRDKFAVCGTYRFAAEYIYSFANIHQAIVLVAVDAEHHIPYACNISMVTTPEEPDLQEPYRDPDWMENHYIRRYFNIDLLRYMTDMPRETAPYYIYALIEDNISNVCRVSFKV